MRRFGLSTRAQHIVIVFHDFSFGGTEVVALRLAGEWLRSGRRVTILCGTLDGPLISSVPAGVQLRTIEREIGRSLFSRLRLRRALPAAIDRLRPDILFLPGNYHLMLSAATRYLPRRPMVVAKISNPLAPTGIQPLRWIFERLYRWAAKDTDALVAMSAGLAEDVRRLRADRDIRVIHDPFPSTSLRAGSTLACGEVLRMVAAGRLVAQKDFALAIRVAAEIARFRKVHLTILGEGPDRKRLERLVRRLGIETLIDLPGHMPAITPTLARADLLLITSQYEGGPAVAVEALGQGVPVIATACSHFLDDLLQHPDQGMIFASRCPRHMARDLMDWIDRADRQPFCGRASVAFLGAPQAAQNYLALFDRLHGEAAS